MIDRPNILFLMTDQMRADALSCMPDSCGSETPRLDELAESGALFDHCYTTSPICAPARASLLTGRYPFQLGLKDNSPHCVPSDCDNWVRLLRDAGYVTSLFGKTHYYAYNGTYPDMRQMEDYMQDLGYEIVDEVPGPRVCGSLMSHMTAKWDELGLLPAYREDMKKRYGKSQAIVSPSILPFDLYPDVYVPRRAYDYLKEYHDDQPFFCMVSFSGPHDPWDCPESYASKFKTKAVKAPLPLFSDRNQERPKGVWDEDPGYDAVTPQQAIALRRDYAANMRLIDDEIGRILDLLKCQGRLGNTIVVLTSDHGEMNGDFRRLFKQNFLQSSVRIPLIISGPGVPPHQVWHDLVELHDIGPSILDLAGVRIPYQQEGVSVFASERRNCVFSEYRGEAMVFDGRWKMVINKTDQPYLLFDLVDDPTEQINLAATGLPVEQKLLQSLLDHRRSLDA